MVPLHLLVVMVDIGHLRGESTFSATLQYLIGKRIVYPRTGRKGMCTRPFASWRITGTVAPTHWVSIRNKDPARRLERREEPQTPNVREIRKQVRSLSAACGVRHRTPVRAAAPRPHLSQSAADHSLLTITTLHLPRRQ